MKKRDSPRETYLRQPLCCLEKVSTVRCRAADDECNKVASFSESFWYFGLASRCSEAELIYFSHQENKGGGERPERYEPYITILERRD